MDNINAPSGGKRTFFSRIARFFKFIYLKLFRIDDTPQKIALGFGLGVFLGVMPGAGPIAALVVSFLFKVNRVSALLGSILTNTWLSMPVFVLSVKTGSVVTGVSYNSISDGWASIIKSFEWGKLFQLSMYQVIFPVLIGYLIVSAVIAVLAYIIILFAAKRMKRKR